jgi:hypothetical protein
VPFELRPLFFSRKASSPKRGGSYFYSLNAVMKGGAKLDLVTDFPNAAEPLFMKQELGRWLAQEWHYNPEHSSGERKGVRTLFSGAV